VRRLLSLQQAALRTVHAIIGAKAHWGLAAASGGVRFAYVKATEGLRAGNARFAARYDATYATGLIRGACHFTRPDLPGGAAQVGYLLRTDQGRPLPPQTAQEFRDDRPAW
jgi:Glycosyl hydrolases family 25